MSTTNLTPFSFHSFIHPSAGWLARATQNTTHPQTQINNLLLPPTQHTNQPPGRLSLSFSLSLRPPRLVSFRFAPSLPGQSARKPCPRTSHYRFPLSLHLTPTPQPPLSSSYSTSQRIVRCLLSSCHLNAKTPSIICSDFFYSFLVFFHMWMFTLTCYQPGNSLSPLYSGCTTQHYSQNDLFFTC